MSELTRIVVTVPGEVNPEARHRKRWRKQIGGHLDAIGIERPTLPLIITLVRLSPHDLSDTALHAALEPVRCGVARWLETEDLDPRISWYPRQDRCSASHDAVRIEIGHRHDTLPSPGMDTKRRP